MSVTTVNLKEVRRLLAGGAQLLEVLPREEYDDLHLPGATHIALKQLNAQSAPQLDPSRDVVVYCWDALCDMSPRAAARLDTLGFTKIHDYAAGKVDWLAHGLPAEGAQADDPTAGSLARRDAATCSLDDTVADVHSRIGDSPYGFALVLGRGDVLLGRVRRSALESVADAATVESLTEPGPSTIRPHLTVDELHQRIERSEAKALLVTTPEGVLLGVLRRDDVPS